MPRLFSDSSRSYPGRSVRHAVGNGSVPSGNAREDRAEVSRGHSRCRTPMKVAHRLETSPAEQGRSHPTEGPNTEKGRCLNEFP
jgi:hypothetical protein